MNRILIILLFSSVILSAQSDWVKWTASEISYENQLSEHHDYTIDKSSFGLRILSYLRNLYYLLISDADGDNCPFYPSCSDFFVRSVKESNLLKASLMFSDRFIRDMNLFKNKTRYAIHSSQKYFDPINNYLLDTKRINITTGEFID